MSNDDGWVPYDTENKLPADAHQFLGMLYNTIEQEFFDVNVPLDNESCRRMTTRSEQLMLASIENGSLNEKINLRWFYRPDKAHVAILYIS
jgi:hypothetical protein